MTKQARVLRLLKQIDLKPEEVRELDLGRLRHHVQQLRKKGHIIKQNNDWSYTYIGQADRTNELFDELLYLVSSVTRIDSRDIISSSRKSEVVQARHLFCIVAYEIEDNVSKIADYLNKDHSSIIYFLEERMLDRDQQEQLKIIRERMEDENRQTTAELAAKLAIDPENEELKNQLKAIL